LTALSLAGNSRNFDYIIPEAMSVKHVDLELNKIIGTKLLRVRQRAGLSQQNVADDLEFSPTTYSRLDNGKIEFSISRLVQLGDYFDVYAPDFLDPEIEVPRKKEEVKPLSAYKNMEAKLEVLRDLLGEAIK
jgi:transcriptional regulator with XRE-family HTH domain